MACIQTRCRRIWLAIGGVAIIACQPVAVWAAPEITKVSPRYVERGTTAEIVVTRWFDEPREVLWYSTGVRCVATSLDAAKRQLTMTLEVAADCPLGEHPFRIRTDESLSNVGTIHVGPFPIVTEAEKKANSNDTPAEAVPVSPGTTVLGTLSASRREDVDCFRVTGKAGERLSVEVDAVRIADYPTTDPRIDEYDMSVAILDSAGREIARNDDSSLHRQDPLVSVRLPEDGEYVVAVRRAMFFQRDTTYAIHLGSFVRPLAAFPAGGPAGRPLAVTLLGDPLGPTPQTIAVPETPGTFSLWGDAPSPLQLRASPFPNVLEEAGQQETRVPAVPAAVNGILASRGETDRYRLTVKKGEPLRVRVWARSLGMPLDPQVRIRPIAGDGTGGKPELTADDADLASREIIAATGDFPDIFDPSVIWTPKHDGDYLLEIADSRGFGGETAIYRIEIEPPPPVLHAALSSTAFYRIERPRATALVVPRGNRWTINLAITHGQGSQFRGPFDLMAEGLPAGVRLESPRVPAGVASWPVSLVAEPEAAPAAAIVTITARPVDAGQSLVTTNQQNLPRVNYNGNAWRSIRLDRFAVAVVEPAPFSIAVAAPKQPLVRGGEMILPVTITRREGFDEPVEIQAMFAPPGVSLPPAEVVPSAATSVNLRVGCRPDAPLGSGPCYVMAATTLARPGADGKPGEFDLYRGIGGVRVSSPVIEMTVAEPFVTLSPEPQSIRRGERLTYRWSVKQLRPFPGTATARLVGLPVGMTMTGSAPTLDATSSEITFDLAASDEALLGMVSGLTCELVFTIDGEEVLLKTGDGKLRIDPRQN